MTPEKWTDTVSNIKDKFEVIDNDEIELEDEGGINIKYIEFQGPMGKMRLEFITKPVIMDKKTNYSKRIGSETHVEYVYSEDDYSHQFIAYKWDEEREDWLEMDGSMFGS